MECPNLIWCAICLRQSDRQMQPAHYILLALFALHYTYRALIYPYLMSTHTTRMPLLIVLCAGTFCTVNG
jgi:cytochrome bd-type quinol oxidase subunit 2